MFISYVNGTIDKPVQVKLASHTVTSGEDSANSATVAITDVAAIDKVVFAMVESTTGVFRAPQGVVAISGTNVTVADTGLAVSEIVHLAVVSYT